MTHSHQSVLWWEPAKKLQDGLTKSVVLWQQWMKRAGEAQTIIYNLAALFYYDHLCSSRFVSHPPWHFKQKDAFVQFFFCFHQVMLCLVISSHVWCDMTWGAMWLSPINRGIKNSPGGSLIQSWGSGPLTVFWTSHSSFGNQHGQRQEQPHKTWQCSICCLHFPFHWLPSQGSGRWNSF